MISKAYEKADLEIVEFSLEDVITSSAVVTTIPAETSTTLPGTTVPGTTSPPVSFGGGEVTIPWSDFFQ